MKNKTNTPNWVWLLLIAAVFGVSSAGALFQQVDDVPPLLRASWRLQLTSIVLFPLALMQWRVHGLEIKPLETTMVGVQTKMVGVTSF